VMYGELGGGEVDALPFVYPVEICNDCNANVLPAACTNNMPPPIMGGGSPCNPYQDGYIDCCIGDTGQVICPY